MTGFFAGLFVGGFFGALVMAIASAAGHRCPHDVEAGVWCHRCYGEPF